MRQISIAEARNLAVRNLGLDASQVGLEDFVTISALILRAAAPECPCSSSVLVRAVLSQLTGLELNVEDLQEKVEAVLERLIAHGDLYELPASEGKRGLVLYAAPLSFVILNSGAAVLLGVLTGAAAQLPKELAKRVERRGHSRILRQLESEDLRAELEAAGLTERLLSDWLRGPLIESPHDYLASADRLLAAVSRQAAEIPELTILDPEKSVANYKWRWSRPKGSGRFLGRRGQKFGNALWCYVELEGGAPVRFIDLPLRGSRQRGCDEGWRIQLAIDAKRGAPQNFRISNLDDDHFLFEMFSPAPMWATRMWDTLGELIDKRGCLFAYSFRNSDEAQICSFAENNLWLSRIR